MWIMIIIKWNIKPVTVIDSCAVAVVVVSDVVENVVSDVVEVVDL